jgi:hypothetical protein
MKDERTCGYAGNYAGLQSGYVHQITPQGFNRLMLIGDRPHSKARDGEKAAHLLSKLRAVNGYLCLTSVPLIQQLLGMCSLHTCKILELLPGDNCRCAQGGNIVSVSELVMQLLLTQASPVTDETLPSQPQTLTRMKRPCNGTCTRMPIEEPT